ncbi:MAG: dihydropyrimidinase [Anaerolineae bacterium]
MIDLVIRNGTIVTASDAYQADVGIAGHSIAAIGKDLSAPQSLDATGLFVFPGFVDPHVHLQMRVGGLCSADDFVTGTVAAACGGTTTVIDFAETRGGSLAQAVAARRAEADGRVAVDYSLHLTGNTADDGFLAEVRQLVVEGYTSLKCYTTYPGLRVDDAQMLRLFEVCREEAILPMIHCENHAILEHRRRHLLGRGMRSPAAHPLSRPPQAEAEAAWRVLALARTVGLPVYIVHVSAADTVDVLRLARGQGQTVYGEVCPQHLLISDQVYQQPFEKAVQYVYAPPSRSEEHLVELWTALLQGEFQTVATDHCPWNVFGQRDRGRDDFTQIPNGGAGIETRGVLLYTEGVWKRGMPLSRFVEVCATGPARLFGLYPRKGHVAVGADADLVVWEPEWQGVLRQASLHQNVDHCPFEGWEVRGRPRWVLLRGQVIVDAGEFIGRIGQGRFVPRLRFGHGTCE